MNRRWVGCVMFSANGVAVVLLTLGLALSMMLCFWHFVKKKKWRRKIFSFHHHTSASSLYTQNSLLHSNVHFLEFRSQQRLRFYRRLTLFDCIVNNAIHHHPNQINTSPELKYAFENVFRMTKSNGIFWVSPLFQFFEYHKYI